MIVLDTTVLSELMRAQPDQAVQLWFDQQDPSALWTTAVSIYEIRVGLLVLPFGARRSAMQRAFGEVLSVDLRAQVIPLDEHAALAAAQLGATRKAAGRPIPALDTLIAGIALSRGAAVATRNIRHFADLPTGAVDPWASEGI